MKTHTVSTYSFAELSPKAQARALEDHSRLCGEFWESDCTIDDAKQCLAFAGFTIEKVYFSGFWSQGDGACFVGRWVARHVDAAKMRQHAPQDAFLHAIADNLEKWAADYPQASFRVKHSGRYSHEFCTEFAVDLYGDAEPSEEQRTHADDAEKGMIEEARDAMRWIYRQLQADYEFVTAEPQVRESIEANECEFNADGSRYRSPL